MLISQAAKYGRDKLSKITFVNQPQLEAEILLADLLKKTREQILIQKNQRLTKKQAWLFGWRIFRRRRGWPLAYLTKNKEFYGYRFLVDKAVLVPRPETELIIDAAKQIAAETTTQDPPINRINIIDVGTGSGCIAITLAKEIKKLLNGAEIQFQAIDISRSALKIAKKNAACLQCADIINFYCGDLLGPVIDSSYFGDPNSKTIITANLPYLNPRQIKNSPSIRKEPRLALKAGRDGLKYYKKLFAQIKTIPNLRSRIYLLCEIDETQSQKMAELSKQCFPDASLRIQKDLAGFDRLAVIEIFKAKKQT